MKLDDLENRERRKNLRLFGLKEKKAETPGDVQRKGNALVDSMFICEGGKEVDIERAHQVGMGRGKGLKSVLLKYLSAPSETYQALQGMVFAIDEINSNPSLLPNITLGFRIYDSCRVMQRSIEGTMWMVTGKDVSVLNFCCQRQPPLMGIIGDAGSSCSIVIARLIGLYRLPQISYVSTSPLLSDRIQFPSFFRTISSDTFQSQGLAQLLMHFRWTWVGLLVEDNDYGLQGARILEQELANAGACIAFNEKIIVSQADRNGFHIIQVIRNSTANAIVIFSSDAGLRPLIDQMMKQNVTGKVFIASEGWSTSATLSIEKYKDILAGTIGLAMYSGEMPGFKVHLNSVHPSKSKDNVFLPEFWEAAFNCKWSPQNVSTTVWGGTMSKQCTGEEKIEDLQGGYNDVTNLRSTYNVYKAVYSSAWALHDLISCKTGGDRSFNGACADDLYFQPWQIFHYVKNVRFQTKAGEEIFFNHNGEVPVRYDIVNWQRGQDGGLRQVTVGSYDSNAAQGLDIKISSSLLWPSGTTQLKMAKSKTTKSQYNLRKGNSTKENYVPVVKDTKLAQEGEHFDKGTIQALLKKIPPKINTPAMEPLGEPSNFNGTQLMEVSNYEDIDNNSLLNLCLSIQKSMTPQPGGGGADNNGGQLVEVQVLCPAETSTGSLTTPQDRITNGGITPSQAGDLLLPPSDTQPPVSGRDRLSASPNLYIDLEGSVAADEIRGKATPHTQAASIAELQASMATMQFALKILLKLCGRIHVNTVLHLGLPDPRILQDTPHPELAVSEENSITEVLPTSQEVEPVEKKEVPVSRKQQRLIKRLENQKAPLIIASPLPATAPGPMKSRKARKRARRSKKHQNIQAGTLTSWMLTDKSNDLSYASSNDQDPGSSTYSEEDTIELICAHKFSPSQVGLGVDVNKEDVDPLIPSADKSRKSNQTTIPNLPTGNKEPVSVCSQSCAPGFRKAAIEGKPLCCFQCVPCAQGEISNWTDSAECFKCPWDWWPNSGQNHCTPKSKEFLSYEETLGAVLTAICIPCSLMPTAILGLFFNFRNTPIVKANNRSLSYLLLLSLTLCFLCSFGFIGYPTPEKCLLRQVAFGITFALCVSCILAKTIIVVIAFNATKPNSNLSRWARPQFAYIAVSVCTFIQVLLCVSWLIGSPPFSVNNIRTQPGMIIVECNEGSSFAFWCMLGYLGLLATISFIVAFLARKLPDSFNETKFITFSMLAFLSVWISFIPAYLSTKGKYMVAMEIFAILASSSALVSCIFFPKCFIILLRPEMNTREHLMGRTTAPKNNDNSKAHVF
ncbi:extracellular calcium-sensing receptor-like [Ambystoma mexicanum]|uniref:extracellular calcium-sensing receptor-like n=1 Tax=Ambystoma mexicanum TaxID=8296 RepID=UPI0037E94D30